MVQNLPWHAYNKFGEVGCLLGSRPEERPEDTRSLAEGNARAKRARRVAGKTSLTLLSVEEVAAVPPSTAAALWKRNLGNTIVLYERDKHGRMYVLVGAFSNLRDPDHNFYRTPQDTALIEDLQRRVRELRVSSKPPEEIMDQPEPPDEPPGSPKPPSKPSFKRAGPTRPPVRAEIGQMDHLSLRLL
jgi:hypothetical protein